MLKNVAVMAGGQSRRFTRDKTLELFHGKKLIEYAVDEFRGRAESLAVVAKDCGKYSFLGIDCIKDDYDVQCPMVGILTALKRMGGPVFVIAADTPLVMYKHAERLFEAVRGHNAAIPVVGGKHHPLYACYDTGMIKIFEDAVSRGEYGLMRSFGMADVIYLTESEILNSENEKKSFINVNTEEDLNGIK